MKNRQNEFKFVTNSEDQLLEFIHMQIVRGISTEIVCHDKESEQLLRNSLTSKELYSEFVDDDELDINELKKNVKQIQSIHQTPSFFSGYHASRHQVKRILFDWYQAIFGDLAWWQVVEIQQKAEFEFPKEYLNTQMNHRLFEFSKKEYWFVGGRVEQAKRVFKTSYIVHDEHNLFDQSVYRNTVGGDGIIVLKKYLNEFYKRSNEILKSYVGFISSYHQKNKQDILEKLISIRKSLFTLSTDFQNLEIKNRSKLEKSKILGFGRKIQDKTDVQGLINRLNDLISQLNDLELFEYRSLLDQNNESAQAEMADELETLETITQQAYFQLDELVGLKMKRLNVKSFTDEELGELEQSFNDFVEDINHVRIFRQEIQNNSISSLKKFELLKEIQQKLFLAIDQLTKVGEYFEWKSFVESLDDKVQHVLEILKNLPNEFWLDAFDSWYLYKVVEKHRSIDFENFEAFISELDIPKSRSINHEELVESWYASIGKEFNEWARNNPEHLDFLLKKKNNIPDHLDVKPFHTFQSLCKPITFNQKEQVSGSRHTQLYFHKQKDIRNEDVFDLNLNDSTRLITQSMMEESLSNQLKFAELLAEQFIPMKSQLLAFIGEEEKYLISVSPWTFDLIWEQIGQKKLKPFSLENHFTNRLTEYFLLSSTKTYFVYQNLPFLSYKADYLEQYDQFIELMSKGHVTLLNIDSSAMLTNPELINEMFTQLK